MWRSVLLAVVLVVSFTATAQADLYTVFDRATAMPGDVVKIRTTGIVTGSPRITVYLVPLRLARSGAHQTSTGPPRDRRWIRVGPLVGAGSKTRREARISFVLPATLPAGDYTTGFWCRPCAPPNGATFTSAQPGQRWSQKARLPKIIRVLPPKPSTPGETLSVSQSAPSRLWLAALAAATLVAAATAFTYRRARR